MGTLVRITVAAVVEDMDRAPDAMEDLKDVLELQGFSVSRIMLEKSLAVETVDPVDDEGDAITS